MRRRNLVSLIVVLVLIIIIGMLPWIDGFLFKKNYLNLIDVINLDNRVRIQLLDYNEGWFSSYAKIQVTPVNSSRLLGDKSPPNFTIEHQIFHGPIVIDKITGGMHLAYGGMQSYIHFPDELEKKLLGAPNAEGVIRIFTLSKCCGAWKNHIEIPMLTVPLPDENGKATWQGLTGEINFKIDEKNAVVRQVDSEMKIGSLMAQGNFGQITQINTQAITYENHAVRQPVGLWDGEALFTMPLFSLKKVDGSNLIAEQVSMKNSFNVTNGSYSNMLGMSMQKLTLPDNRMPVLSPVSITLSINNVNAQALVDLINFAKAMQGKRSPDSAQQYMKLIPRLVTAETTATETVLITTSLGNARSDGKIFWTSAPTNAMEYLSKTNANLTIRAAVPLIDKILEIFSQPVTTTTATTAQAPEKAPTPNANISTIYSDKVAQLLQQGKITLPVSVQLIGFQDQHLNMEVFTTNVDQLSLASDVAAEIKLAYQQQLSALQEAAMAAQQAQATQSAQTSSTSNDMLKQMFNSWISQGYIMKDNNDYVIEITFENGITKVNGKDIEPLSTMPMMPGMQDSAIPSMPAPSSTTTMPTTTTPTTTAPSTMPTTPSTTPSTESSMTPSVPSATTPSTMPTTESSMTPAAPSTTTPSTTPTTESPMTPTAPAMTTPPSSTTTTPESSSTTNPTP